MTSTILFLSPLLKASGNYSTIKRIRYYVNVTYLHIYRCSNKDLDPIEGRFSLPKLRKQCPSDVQIQFLSAFNPDLILQEGVRRSC